MNMANDFDRDADLGAEHALTLTRRALLQSAFAAGGIAGVAARSPLTLFAAQESPKDKPRTGSPNVALEMARLLNRPRYGDLPPKAIDHAKVLVASTVAAAASGSTYPSSRIIRE